MPPTSEQLPLLGIYYAVTICIVSMSTGMSVLTLHINNKGHRASEVPGILKIIFFDGIARFLGIQLESSRRLFKRHTLNLNLKSNGIKTEKSTIKLQNKKFNCEHQES